MERVIKLLVNLPLITCLYVLHHGLYLSFVHKQYFPHIMREFFSMNICFTSFLAFSRLLRYTFRKNFYDCKMGSAYSSTREASHSEVNLVQAIVNEIKLLLTRYKNIEEVLELVKKKGNDPDAKKAIINDKAAIVITTLLLLTPFAASGGKRL